MSEFFDAGQRRCASKAILQDTAATTWTGFNLARVSSLGIGYHIAIYMYCCVPRNEGVRQKRRGAESVNEASWSPRILTT